MKVGTVCVNQVGQTGEWVGGRQKGRTTEAEGRLVRRRVCAVDVQEEGR